MKIILLIILFISGPLFSQQEFLVNSHILSGQRDPHTGRDAEGNYVVLWQSNNQAGITSGGDIYLQLFNSDGQKSGAEILVNDTTENEQIKPALAMNTAGSFITAWQSYSNFNSIYDIKAKLFKNGLARGSEFIVNSTRIHSQVNPETAISSDGEFLIVWESWYQDGSNKGVYGQRYDSSGSKIGQEFLVNTTTKNSQARPVARYFPDGRFIIIWESWGQDMAMENGFGLFGQVFSADGQKTGNEFQLNSYSNDYQWLGDIEIISNNSFAATWCSWQQDGDFGGIYLQLFADDGSKTGGETLVNRQTAWYQWLPKIKKLNTGNLAIVWSSFKQDGSREGVYCRLFTADGNPLTLESPVNDYTDGFQWEADFIIGEENEMTVFWSSWGQYENDYEIIGKQFTPIIPAGQINPDSYEHNGRSSAQIKVHVLDSTLVTGHQYEVSFNVFPEDSVVSTIQDLNTSSNIIENFPIAQGKNFFYITAMFDGVAVEYLPEYRLSLDINRSYFENQSATNLQFRTNLPAAGAPLLAPIDMELRWGNTDTLSNRYYAEPSDTAIGIDGIRDIVLPFKAWNTTDNEPVALLVLEQSANGNNRWDVDEGIVFLTPQPYRQSSSNTHAQIDIVLPDGQIQMPARGDVNFIYTKKPLTNDDKFYFETSLDYLTQLKHNLTLIPAKFELFQNYPNPFNASTTIKYFIPQRGKVRLFIYNILGQRVKTLIDRIKDPGAQKVVFDASTLASGIYFYSFSFNNMTITKKMLLVK